MISDELSKRIVAMAKVWAHKQSMSDEDFIEWLKKESERLTKKR